VVAGLLSLGRILARSQIEYAAIIERTSTGALLTARLCGSTALLLWLALLADILWFRAYPKLLPLGGLMLLLEIMSGVSQRVGQTAARRHLMTDG
jgi:hypothetical protein